MTLRARAQHLATTLAAGLVLAASALPTTVAFAQCRTMGVRGSSMPCCARTRHWRGDELPTVRSQPCCEGVTVSLERLPGAASHDGRSGSVVARTAVSVVDPSLGLCSDNAWRWRLLPISTAAGPPIFLETCSLLI